MQPVQHRHKRILKQIHRLAQHITNGQLPRQKLLIIPLHTPVEIPQRTQRKRLTPLRHIRQIERHRILRALHRHPHLGITVHRHRQRRLAIDHRMFPGQNQFTWSYCFHLNPTPYPLPHPM